MLIKQGAEVRVVMTEAAQQFIRPLTFQALTGHTVYAELFEADAQNAMDHIELARWADLLLIAPATANTIARLADGYADNLLLTIALATKCRIAIAPAMNQQMFQHPANLENLSRLQARGVLQWGPDEGEQACGDIGPGRMLEPSELVSRVQRLFQPGRLAGSRVMITAGPTREAIDPVRYISNRSSGKMGYALVEAAIAAGAEVTLVSGPVCLSPPQSPSLKLLAVQTADEMYAAVMSGISEQDIFIATAAVADYRVEAVATHKIKKSAERLQLNLLRNRDILAAVAALDQRPFCVGFAAETRDLESYALAKLDSKRLDMIAANRVDDAESGFEVDFNALTVFWKDGSCEYPRQTKKQLALRLIDKIADNFERSPRC